ALQRAKGARHLDMGDEVFLVVKESQDRQEKKRGKRALDPRGEGTLPEEPRAGVAHRQPGDPRQRHAAVVRAASKAGVDGWRVTLPGGVAGVVHGENLRLPAGAFKGRDVDFLQLELRLRRFTWRAGQEKLRSP